MARTPGEKLAPRLSKEESRLVIAAIGKRGYTEAEVGEVLGYTNIGSTYGALRGSRGIPVERRTRLYEKLGRDPSLRFLVDFSGQEGELTDVMGRLAGIYENSDPATRDSILAVLETLCRTYTPKIPSNSGGPISVNTKQN